MYIIKYFNSNDGKDVECFVLCNENILNKLEEKSKWSEKKIYVCGTQFNSVKHFYDSLYIKKLNDKELDVLLSLFGTEFGSYNLQKEIENILNDEAYENPHSVMPKIFEDYLEYDINKANKYLDGKLKYTMSIVQKIDDSFNED